MTLKIIKRRYLLHLWSWSWFFLIILLFYPISYGILRLATVLLFLWLLFGGLWLFWQYKIIRFTYLLLTFIISLIMILPGNAADTNTLREYYVQEMQAFNGTKYVWGGENRVGIDCSGLVRQGLVNANLKYGFISLNPKLIREGFSLWWFDTSAQALAQGYRDKTKVFMSANSINELDHTKIQKGDIAVTQDGVHTLGYIGDNVWIEADPGVRKVITVQVPDQNNYWVKVPVYLVKWQQFN
ncbi:MAG TPA: NlpC/P60 family protein [Nostocaceae cyanobacterium]|nr:NlpC/P60 family protein [Nostocaceae cyanobacterium]